MPLIGQNQTGTRGQMVGAPMNSPAVATTRRDLPRPGGASNGVPPNAGAGAGGGGGRPAAPGQPPNAMFRDPNNGNLFQWNPAGAGGGWQSFSQGQGDMLDFTRRAQMTLNNGGGDVLPRVSGGAGNSRAAEAAEFSRAKDRIGQATSGLLRSVGNTMDERGIAGSSIEGDALSGALEQGQGMTGDVIRQQAITGVNRGYAVDDRDYAGDIAQRGQDMARQAQQQQALQALIHAAYSGGMY